MPPTTLRTIGSSTSQYSYPRVRSASIGRSLILKMIAIQLKAGINSSGRRSSLWLAITPWRSTPFALTPKILCDLFRSSSLNGQSFKKLTSLYVTLTVLNCWLKTSSNCHTFLQLWTKRAIFSPSHARNSIYHGWGPARKPNGLEKLVLWSGGKMSANLHTKCHTNKFFF